MVRLPLSCGRGGGFTNHEGHLPLLLRAYSQLKTQRPLVDRDGETELASRGALPGQPVIPAEKWLLPRHKGPMVNCNWEEKGNRTSIASAPRLRQLCEREGTSDCCVGTSCLLSSSLWWNWKHKKLPGSWSYWDSQGRSPHKHLNVSSRVSSVELWRELGGHPWWRAFLWRTCIPMLLKVNPINPLIH